MSHGILELEGVSLAFGGLTVVDGLVLAVFAPSLESEAVKVAVPAVFGVTE